MGNLRFVAVAQNDVIHENFLWISIQGMKLVLSAKFELV